MSQFRLEYSISRSPRIVWDKFFNETNLWWPKDFYTNPRTMRFVIDSVIGGKMYEDFGEGEGLIWGDVIGVDRPRSLQIRGMLSGDLEGLRFILIDFNWIRMGQQTRFQFISEFITQIDDKTLQSLKSGWETIFKDYFLPFCRA